MKKQIKDYLHFYLGCECEVANRKTLLIGCHTNGNYQIAHAIGAQDYWQAKYIKPILRPLSDMTEKDANKITWHLSMYAGNETQLEHHFIQALIHGSKYVLNMSDPDTFEIMRTLCKLEFDVFGLIEAGLAVDKTTIPV